MADGDSGILFGWCLSPLLYVSPEEVEEQVGGVLGAGNITINQMYVQYRNRLIPPSMFQGARSRRPDKSCLNFPFS